MSLLTWSVGDRQPSITEQVTSGGVPVNLSSSTAQFKMRPVGSTALKVNATATVVSPKADGNLQYDWGSTDLDTAGTYLIWWELTTSGSVQTVGESLIEVRAHNTVSSDVPGYCELAELKNALSLTSQTYVDLDAELAILAASRAIDNACGRFFYSIDDVSYYDAPSFDLVVVDDVHTITEFAIDLSGTGTNYTAQATTGWVAGPYNSPSVEAPYEWIRLRNYVAPYFPTWYQKTIRVTGTHGWPSVPAPIKQATLLLAHRFVRRTREAPMSIMTLGQEGMRAVKIEQSDPDVYMMIGDYVRKRQFA